ncbi:uncharacterized protein TM35_001121060 [Trypanosoma theileri]|uniref:Uncharacterized protein n=1 Tax=Trypanosoma theileri TaxID=67003 RepID=A0A1X0NFE1_9TRYP|nr:uncharacterized protein TM35_001121060 [Trypanosoma theileri]ORC81589.1 hypothetical protein TM35_001121060 [Trypanosoma theileri]
MMMRPVVCLLVFMLSVASVCAEGDGKADEALPLEAAASECPTESQGHCTTKTKPAVSHPPPLPVQPPQAPPGGDDCTNGHPCSTSSSRVSTTASPTNCANPAKKEGCPDSVPQTESNCPGDSGDNCQAPQQALTQTRKDHHDGHDSKGDRGLSGSETPDSPGKTGQTGPGGPSTDTDPSNPSPTTAEPALPAAPVPSDESVGASTSAAPPESSSNSDANGNLTKEDGDATKTPSNTSEKENTDGSENTENGTTSEGGESTINTADWGNAESTTTTTTTTTLPPEPINNKKGDADSSSSISSSVWVRVPLLIVVTLACILVC